MFINGLKVVDAKRPLHIVLTSRDVKRAVPKAYDSCAFALSGKRTTGATVVQVWRSHAYFLMGKLWVRYVVPQNMHTELVAYDKGAKHLTLGAYTFPAPTNTQTLGARNGSKKNGHKRSGKKRRPQIKVSDVREHAHGFTKARPPTFTLKAA